MSTQGSCPFSGGSQKKPTSKDWWPNQLDLKLLNQHSPSDAGSKTAKEWTSV